MKKITNFTTPPFGHPLGMSVKQMAQLLNVTERSVLTIRYRIKKKLKLEDKEKLTTFMGNL